MRDALAWLGLDWDVESLQSDARDAHASALDLLAARDRLYPCACSRSEVRRAGRPAADGGWRYPGTCRARALPPGGWRAVDGAVRLRLAPGRVACTDESGLDLSQDPFEEMGDPVLVRRDGAFAYHLACVVDDGRSGVTRIVRGRDLAPSTAIHLVLQGALGWPRPGYRHHFLLLERSGDKLAKLHGAVGWRALREHLDAAALCGRLAAFAGLLPVPRPVRPDELVTGFDWARVRERDLALAWTGSSLEPLGGSVAERVE